MPNSPKIEIYVVGHKVSESIPSHGVFIPIQVGQGESFCSVRDNTGDNIAAKNDSFCELTALYWIWKNTSGQDYVGLFHYRRHLNLSSELYKENKWGFSEYKRIDSVYLQQNELTDQAVKMLVPNYDIILPKKWDVRNGRSKWTSIERHYELASHHFISDYKQAIAILKAKYPSYSLYADKVNMGSRAYFCNMFIMRRDMFDKYCEWLFSILFELKAKLNISSYSAQEKRVFGYISERLFSIYIEKLCADIPQLKVKTLQRTFIEYTESMPKPLPFYKTNNIGIAMAFNDTYASAASVTICSIIEHASPDKNYDINILASSISPESKRILERTIDGIKNFNIRWVNIDFLPIPETAFTHLHFSKDVYSRLFIPSMFSAYEKLIYIDADMVALKDVADLYKIDLGEKALGVVRCSCMAAFCEFKVKSYPYGIEARAYLTDILHLANPDDYFQAGIILFSIANALKKQDIIASIVSKGIKYWYLDQDILNSTYQGNVVFVDPRWNVFNEKSDTPLFVSKLPAAEKNIYPQARETPFVIHFAGPDKPWLRTKGDFPEIFWQYARKTPFYESLLKTFLANSQLRGQNTQQRSIKEYVLFGTPLWTVKQVKSGKRYNIGPIRIAKTKEGRENTYLYVFGIKCASLRRH